MRHSRPVVLTLALAFLLTACSSGAASPSASVAPSTAPSVAPSATPAASRGADPGRRCLRDGQPAGPDRGHAHDRHRQPGLPAVLRSPPTARPPRRGSSATRPTARASRARSPTRSRDQLGFTIDEVTWVVVAVRQRVRAGRRRPSTSTSTRSRTSPSGPQTVDLIVRLLHRQPGRRRRSAGNALAKVTIAGRAEGATSSAPRSARPAYDTINDTIEPDDRGQGLQHERRRHRRAQGQADRRHRRRPADRVLHDRGPGRRRRSSSASSRPRPAPTPSTSASSSPRAAR